MIDTDAISANWSFPTRILAGPGRIAELPALLRELECARPLLVSDAGLATTAMISDALHCLHDNSFDVALFADVQGNPTGTQVDTGTGVYRQGNHDCVVAIGGGSALDVGKAIAFIAGQQRPLWDFEDAGDNWRRADTEAIAPVIAIPTTAGTGSEVGRAAVISNEARHCKVIVFHPGMLPAAVILDPELTVGLPSALTAATGLDAFVHCFEAFCAPGFHPLADAIALHGMRLVSSALPRAFRNGSDLEARAQMQVAASMGATAFQKGLGMVHAIAHAVGALYNTHHGLTNAILLPYVMQFNCAAIAQRMPQVAQAMGLAHQDFDSVYEAVNELRQTLEIPPDLGSIGVSAERAEEIATLAARDPSAAGNPIAIDVDDCRRVFLAAVAGT